MKLYNIVISSCLAVASLTACSNDDALNVGSYTIASDVIKIGDYPAFASSATRTDEIGTYNAGKSSWKDGDEIYVKFEGLSAPSDIIILKYDGDSDSWNVSNGEIQLCSQAYDAQVKYTAYYSANLESDGQNISLSDASKNATEEFLVYESEPIAYRNFKGVEINFERNYSRLRIACGDAESITATFTGFTPVYGDAAENDTYTLTPDEEGNAYLYGTWNEGSSIAFGESSVEGITVGASGLSESVNGKAYAVSATKATIDLTKFKSYETAKTGLEKFATANPSIVDYKIIGPHDRLYDSSEECTFFNVKGNDLYKVKSLDLSEITNMTTVGIYEFYDLNNLKTIKLPEGITAIGDYAFTGCGFETFDMPNTVTSVGTRAFEGCANLKNVRISSKLSSLSDYIFKNCSSLVVVEIPENIKSLGKYTFYGCTSLENVTLPDAITTIPDYCFANCQSLESIIIPSAVTTIGSNAFQKCSMLATVTCLAKREPTIKTNTFIGTPSTKTLYVPSESVEDYEDSDWNDYFSSIEAIPSN